MKTWTVIFLGTSQSKALHISILDASDLRKGSVNDLRMDLGYAVQSNRTCCVTALDPRGERRTNWRDEGLGKSLNQVHCLSRTQAIAAGSKTSFERDHFR
jgi:hypothetical protein